MFPSVYYLCRKTPIVAIMYNINLSSKVLFIAIAMAGSSMSTYAQDVFKEIQRMSKAVAKDPTKDIETRKIATFKSDVLTYMGMKIRENVVVDTANIAFFNENVKILNEQSLAMYEFLNMFMEKLSTAGKGREKDIIMTVFKAASINNPYFMDNDHELVLAYYNNDKYLTQFSLDTDWIKALGEVKKRKW